MIVVLIEHIIIGLKMLIATLIKDKPDWITREEHEQREGLEKLYDLLDQKKEDYKQKGHELLEDKVKKVKEAQMKKLANLANQAQDEESKAESAHLYLFVCV
jgi:hypothetical protein